MSAFDPFLIRSFGPSGEQVVRLGVQLLDDYLDFVAARRRPNTVLATAYDLLVFFRVVDKAQEQVSTADVLEFVTAQRYGAPAGGLRVVEEGVGVECPRGLLPAGSRSSRGCCRLHHPHHAAIGASCR